MSGKCRSCGTRCVETLQQVQLLPGLGADQVPQGPPSPTPSLPSLWPMVTHCSAVRMAGMCRLATSGSTLMQYSVFQKRLRMWNSEAVSHTSYCNERAQLVPERWSPGSAPSSSSIPWRKPSGA